MDGWTVGKLLCLSMDGNMNRWMGGSLHKKSSSWKSMPLVGETASSQCFMSFPCWTESPVLQLEPPTFFRGFGWTDSSYRKSPNSFAYGLFICKTTALACQVEHLIKKNTKNLVVLCSISIQFKAHRKCERDGGTLKTEGELSRFVMNSCSRTCCAGAEAVPLGATHRIVL